MDKDIDNRYILQNIRKQPSIQPSANWGEFEILSRYFESMFYIFLKLITNAF